MANSEKTLDRALSVELERSDAFLRWFLSQTGFADEVVQRVLIRSDSPWGKVEVRLWNAASQSYEVASREGETDLLIVLQSQRRGRFALHVENKRSSGRFTAQQPELYRARAAAWAGKAKYGDYEEWETVLVAPLSFYERNQYEARKFNRYISHEEIAAHIPEFRVAVEQSIPGDGFKATRA